MKAVIIVGPTSSGKTDLSLKCFNLGFFFGIVNADASQAYRQVSIGVAKPTIEQQKQVPHFLFNIVDCVPHAFDAAHYRVDVDEVCSKNATDERLPLIVGGSFFYIKSLFYRLAQQKIDSVELIDISWEHLERIDPARAAQIHPHDAYRIRRALEIFYGSGGTLPSQLKPSFDPLFDQALFVYVSIESGVLRSRISDRAHHMLTSGWIEEVEGLINTDWEPFVKQGCAIGYDDIYDWIKRGKHNSELRALEDAIVKKTWHYARRQQIFWRGLRKSLETEYGIQIVESNDQNYITRVVGRFAQSNTE